MSSDKRWTIRLAVLDNLAQLALFRDDIEGCGQRLDEIRALTETLDAPGRSWYDLASDQTRCSYLAWHEEWDAIIELVDATDIELERRQFRALRTSLLCAKARALAALGRHSQAESTLTLAMRQCPRGAADPLLVIETTRAVCQARRRRFAAAATHFDRALASCLAIGHKLWARQIERDRKALVPPEETAPLSRATGDPEMLGAALTEVAGLLQLGPSTDLLIHRTTTILRATALGSRLDVRTRPARGDAGVPAVTLDVGIDGTCAIQIQEPDRLVTILAREASSLEEIALMRSAADVLRAAVAYGAGLETSKADPLWPGDETVEDDTVVFRSPRMQEILRVARRLAASNLPILLTGETGTGKEVLARLIHQSSGVKHGPFMPFNCAAMPRDLVESQLFGHRRGAFTGAVDSLPGIIRAADKGTLFLDEVGELDLAVQPKLLRFLESAEIQPVGETRPLKVSARILAATNANLDDRIARGEFRRDLFYRLGVARVSLPTLRERRDEIPALALLFASRFARECHHPGVHIGDDLMAALLVCEWPGNVRQLANEVRRMVAVAEPNATLTARDLSPEVRQNLSDLRPEAAKHATVEVSLDQPLDRAIEDLEKAFVDRAMNMADGRVNEAAQLLGISRKGLFLKRRRWGL